MTDNTFSARLVHARSSRGLSRYALSKQTSISYTALRLLEIGESDNPQRTTVEELASVLECSPEWLMWGAGDPPADNAPSPGEAA